LVSIVDIASTILALTKDVNNFEHGDDGLNILPFATGILPPPEDRIYFWANNSNYNHLDFVAEKTPKINMFPESPEGKDLYKEMISQH